MMAKNPEIALFLNQAIETGIGNKLINFDNDGNGYHDDFGQKAIDHGLDLMSNDMAMIIQTGWFRSYYSYSGRTEVSFLTKNLWNYYTFIIFNLNTIIKNLEEADQSNPEVLTLKGRAHGMRAFCNFMLIRLYADGDKGIPYATEKESHYKRATTAELEAFIEKDLLLAYDLVADGSGSKELLTKPIVAGLLSRYYLYKKDNVNVIKYADLALANYSEPISFDVINDGFNDIGNRDWMWGKEKNPSNSTSFVSFFGFMDSYNPGGYVAYAEEYKMIDARLYNGMSTKDKRKTWFSDGSEEYGIPLYANATKFVDNTSDFTGDYIYMRATEIFLNKAEAAAEMGDYDTAKKIISDVMSTRDEDYENDLTGNDLIQEIRTQRRVELWGEGFSFFDMKRWGIELERAYPGSNHGLSGQLSYPARSQKFIFQFPISEIQANDALTPADQNPY
ncbi:MAG: RagB/SusD family nutrient uptake outer membrane protein [Myroides odoratus]|nr:RagB/SusD family nutrient uptake outer membrane protein [Myroides odoratus]